MIMRVIMEGDLKNTYSSSIGMLGERGHLGEQY